VVTFGSDDAARRLLIFSISFALGSGSAATSGSAFSLLLPPSPRSCRPSGCLRQG
jgi:hypothetical protein